MRLRRRALVGYALRGRLRSMALQTHAADGPGLVCRARRPQPWPQDEAAGRKGHQVDWHSGHDRAAFDAAMARIQQAIAAGEPKLGQLHRAPHGHPAGQPGGAVRRAAARPARWLRVCTSTRGHEQVLRSRPNFFDWRMRRAAVAFCPPHEGHGPARRHARSGSAQAALRTAPKRARRERDDRDLLRNDLRVSRCRTACRCPRCLPPRHCPPCGR